MDASQSSMVALDASTIATDSTIPRPQRKRRRTTIVDQLQQIDLSSGGVPNQILNVAGGNDDNSQISSSSDEEDDEDNDQRIMPLSDAQVAQRIAMRELVFGRPPSPPPPNPVDAKVNQLIRQSLDQVRHGQHPFAQLPANTISESQDDMTIDPVYTRASSPDSLYHSAYSPLGAASTMTGGNAPMEMMPPPQPNAPPQRQRSNSLPEGLMDDAMELT